MKIEVFYVPACPYHSAALLRRKEILAADVATEIHEVAGCIRVANSQVFHLGKMIRRAVREARATVNP